MLLSACTKDSKYGLWISRSDFDSVDTFTFGGTEFYVPPASGVVLEYMY